MNPRYVDSLRKKTRFLLQGYNIIIIILIFIIIIVTIIIMIISITIIIIIAWKSGRV